MGRVHLEAVQRVESVEAAAIFGRNADASARWLPASPSPKRASDYREFFGSGDRRRAYLHAQRAALLDGQGSAAAGKHVLCEKPLTTAVAEAEELVALAARSKTPQLRVPQSALLPSSPADARAT